MKMRSRIIVWTMLAVQMASWGWFQSQGGQLGDRSYVVFCIAMMIGQAGGTIECLAGKAWGTMILQLYFLAWTAVGMIVRLQHMA